MTDRGDGDRRGERGEGHRGGGRRRAEHHRAPPPDTTGEESRYLARLKERRTPLTVVLTDGEVVRGWVEYYDRDMIKINRDQGPNVFIRKVHIRTMQEDDGEAS